MKRTILAIALIAAFGVAHAGTSTTAVSSAGVQSGAVTGNFGNGFAKQYTGVSAQNQSQASATKVNLPFGLGSISNTSGASAGSTGALSFGVSFGAFGATGGTAHQSGFGIGATW